MIALAQAIEMVEIIHSTMRSTKNAGQQLQATIMDLSTDVCQWKGIHVKSARMQRTSGVEIVAREAAT